MRHARHGFAMVLAIVLLGLVGTLLGVLATQTNGEIRRSRTAGADAQLRQLLIAGEASCRSRLASPPKEPELIPLPQSLADAKLTIACTDLTPDRATFRIDALIASRHAAQVLVYQRAPRPRLLSATLSE